jgi:hypothetical protein
MSNSSESHVEPGGVVLLLVVIVVGIVLIVDGIRDNINTDNFDKAFEADSINFNANYIPLGEEGVPFTSTFPEWVPEGGSVILGAPRFYQISVCKGYTLPENAEGVFAATSFYQPDLIEVSVPRLTTGYLNVCVPSGTEIDVVLWAKVPGK